MQRQRRHAAEDVAKQKLVDVLVNSHDFPVPQRMVERQIDSRIERSLRAFRNQGIDPAQLDLDWKKLRENERPRALRDVKAGFLIARIAEVEGIKPTPDEVDEQIRMFAARDKISLAEARRKLAGDGTLDRINDHLRHEKTLSFLFDEAEKVEPPSEPEQPVEEAAAESVGVEE
jgi:trigger factor